MAAGKVMVKLSLGEKEKLISLVEKFPVIYDKTSRITSAYTWYYLLIPSTQHCWRHWRHYGVRVAWSMLLTI